jgi:hypothetical protein
MLGVLVEIEAHDRLGTPMLLRFASHDTPELCHFAAQAWEPAIVQLPDFALDFFGGAFAGQVTAPRTGFAVLTADVTGFASNPARRAVFADARVRIWAGPIEAASPHDESRFRMRFDGRLTGEPEIDEAGRVARFDAAVQDNWANKPLLSLFAGTGGTEGPEDLEGQTKPLALGNVRFARGVLIDNVDNVWMVSHGAVEGIGAAYDRLASLGPSSGDHPDLAALLAASIPNGSWATCLSLGLVRFGAPPDGRVSFDVQGSNAGTGGYVRRPGAMIRRIADLAAGTVDAASLAALDVARPFNLQIQLSEQTTAREVIAQIADSVASVAGVSLTGALFVQPLGFGTASETLNADGSSALPVLAVEELAKSAPSWKLATEAELTFEVHSADEAAFGYRWQGEYSASRVYRLDDVVFGPDAAAWAYINSSPASGQDLPVWPDTSNDHWRVFSPPGGAGITVDENGILEGIGTPDINVDNRGVVPSGDLADRPVSGAFVGQTYLALDTGELFRWDGSAWTLGTDLTAAAVRSIEPEFATVEIRKFEAGNVGSRTVSHFAKRGSVAIGGGTWSLPQVLLGAGSASINASTGLVTLSGIAQSGSYTIRYTHTDGVQTDLKMNVSFISQEATVRSINASPSTATWFEDTTTSRTVSHSAIEGGSTLTGGTWSLEASSAGITASINASSGSLSITGVTESGTYRVRYTHTDTVETELVVNVIFYPAGSPSSPTDPDYNIP